MGIRQDFCPQDDHLAEKIRWNQVKQLTYNVSQCTIKLEKKKIV